MWILDLKSTNLTSHFPAYCLYYSPSTKKYRRNRGGKFCSEYFSKRSKSTLKLSTSGLQKENWMIGKMNFSFKSTFWKNIFLVVSCSSFILHFFFFRSESDGKYVAFPFPDGEFRGGTTVSPLFHHLSEKLLNCYQSIDFLCKLNKSRELKTEILKEGNPSLTNSVQISIKFDAYRILFCQR